uniref:Uncharacterized protein n=1 Tax=Sphaerodactylus townsendi TaxID=933632 RepID=A0ACB8EZQ0_9SAUR
MVGPWQDLKAAQGPPMYKAKAISKPSSLLLTQRATQRVDCMLQTLDSRMLLPGERQVKGGVVLQKRLVLLGDRSNPRAELEMESGMFPAGAKMREPPDRKSLQVVQRSVVRRRPLKELGWAEAVLGPHLAENAGALDPPQERGRGGGGSGQGPGNEIGGEVVPVHHTGGDQGEKVTSDSDAEFLVNLFGLPGDTDPAPLPLPDRKEEMMKRKKSKTPKAKSARSQILLVASRFLYVLVVFSFLEEDLEGKTEEEIEMMKAMGFASFDTTKGKKVDGSVNAYAINVSQKRKYRQYMNRKGGFNRPLDFIA